MADLKTPPLAFRPKGRDVLAAVRLRALAPEAMENDAMACMDHVRARFPEYITEDKLAELAAELLRRLGPMRPAKIIPFEGAAENLPAQGSAS